MDAGLLAQYVMNGLMLGMMYALVAVGFTLFFGVLDVIKFSHGDVLTVGAFTGLATYVVMQTAGQGHGRVPPRKNTAFPKQDICLPPPCRNGR